MKLEYREETGNLWITRGKYPALQDRQWFGFSHIRGLLEQSPAFRAKVKEALEGM